MSIQRRISRKIRIGTVEVGGDAPVSIQSMTNTDTRDVAATLDQINRLARLGCEIIRVAVPDEAAADALAELTEKSPLPVIADIHFDYRLALRAIDRHVTAIRLNPGNLDSPEHIRLVAESAVRHGVPIRVGANTGSLRPAVIRSMMERGLSHDDALAEALVISAMKECALLMSGLILSNRILGFVNAPAIAQQILIDAIGSEVDLEIYRARRTAMKEVLDAAGFEYFMPQGAFYFFPKSPVADESKLVDALVKERVLVVPGTGFGGKGIVRLAFCVSEKTISGSKESFIRAMRNLEK